MVESCQCYTVQLEQMPSQTTCLSQNLSGQMSLDLVMFAKSSALNNAVLSSMVVQIQDQKGGGGCRQPSASSASALLQTHVNLPGLVLCRCFSTASRYLVGLQHRTRPPLSNAV